MIRLEGVTKRYRSRDAPALRDVSLTIEQGEFVAVMGPSGSGKSSLLQLMGGLDSPTEGTVMIGGRSLATLDDHELTLLRRHDIGFVFQTFNLVAVLTAEQNVSLPCALAGEKEDRYRDRVENLLRTVGLADRANAKPSELSGGEQQRIAIARALANEPKLVLADEPTGNLDANSARDVLDLLGRLNREFSKTIVLVTHDPHAAKAASTVRYLEKGELLADGVKPQDW